jgi:hypothetical protein
VIQDETLSRDYLVLGTRENHMGPNKASTIDVTTVFFMVGEGKNQFAKSSVWEGNLL